SCIIAVRPGCTYSIESTTSHSKRAPMHARIGGRTEFFRRENTAFDEILSLLANYSTFLANTGKCPRSYPELSVHYKCVAICVEICSIHPQHWTRIFISQIVIGCTITVDSRYVDIRTQP